MQKILLFLIVLKKLISQILVAITSLWLANRFLTGVTFQGSIEMLLVCGLVLGSANAIVKPILKKITFILRILTLGLFNFVINMAILWFVDTQFSELEILGILSLFLTTCIISILNILIKP